MEFYRASAPPAGIVANSNELLLIPQLQKLPETDLTEIVAHDPRVSRLEYQYGSWLRTRHPVLTSWVSPEDDTYQ